MIDHRHIADRLRELEHARREKVQELMAGYDKTHQAKLHELRTACGSIGHNWMVSPHSGDNFRQCVVCGAHSEREGTQ